MLLFRSEDHIERWSRQWSLPRGASLTLEQAWLLADAWYRDRLSEQWRRKSVEEAHSLFQSLGLASDFWKLA